MVIQRQALRVVLSRLAVACRDADTGAQELFECRHRKRWAEVVALDLVAVVATQVPQLGPVSTPSAITFRLRL